MEREHTVTHSHTQSHSREQDLTRTLTHSCDVMLILCCYEGGDGVIDSDTVVSVVMVTNST